MKHPKEKVLFICLSSVLSAPIIAGEAVSEINGKIETLLGSVESNDAKLLAGSLTAPLSSKFGIQGDILAGQLNSKTTNGLGIHLFWRDSDKGLFGITASRTKYDSNKLNRTGLEGEYYFKKATISGELGRQTGDIESSKYGSLNLSYYPINNLALSIGTNRANSNNKSNIDIEYQTKVNGLSLFANASKGDNEYDHIIGGIRYYFGKQKTLIERHRKDDPPSLLFAGASELARATEEKLRAEEAARIAAEEEAARIAAQAETDRIVVEEVVANNSSSGGSSNSGSSSPCPVDMVQVGISPLGEPICEPDRGE